MAKPITEDTRHQLDKIIHGSLETKQEDARLGGLFKQLDSLPKNISLQIKGYVQDLLLASDGKLTIPPAHFARQLNDYLGSPVVAEKIDKDTIKKIQEAVLALQREAHLYPQNSINSQVKSAKQQ